MKIFIVIHNLEGGGAEKMMARLANGLVSLGDDVSVVLLTGGGVNKTILSSKVRLIELKAKRTMTSLFALVRLINSESPDKIISALTHVNVVSIIAGALTQSLKKLYISERNAYSLDRHVNSSMFVKLAYKIAPFLYRNIPNSLLVVSEGVKSDLIEFARVPADKIIALPNPVLDDNFLSYSPKNPVHPWLLNKSKPVIVAVGRLSPQKGFDTLLNSFALVKKSIDCRLIIYGEGLLRESLLEQAQRLNIFDSVSFPGYCGGVLNEMRYADLFVLSSRFEGSPNALVEATSTGIPVISTDCPYGPSEILNDGHIAPLVAVDDHVALADQILVQLLNFDNKKTERISAINRFTITHSAKSYKAAITA